MNFKEETVNEFGGMPYLHCGKEMAGHLRSPKTLVIDKTIIIVIRI